MRALLLAMLLYTSAQAPTDRPLPEASKPITPVAPLLNTRAIWTPPRPMSVVPGTPFYEKPDKKTVETGGRRYTVTTIALKTVTVDGGDSAIPRTEQLKATFGRIAFQATGCQMRNSYWQERALVGTLDCSARVIR